jgi:hypothetical protein
VEGNANLDNLNYLSGDGFPSTRQHTDVQGSSLRDDTPGTMIQETIACWQGRNFSSAHTSRSCKGGQDLCVLALPADDIKM